MIVRFRDTNEEFREIFEDCRESILSKIKMIVSKPTSKSEMERDVIFYLRKETRTVFRELNKKMYPVLDKFKEDIVEKIEKFGNSFGSDKVVEIVVEISLSKTILSKFDEIKRYLDKNISIDGEYDKIRKRYSFFSLAYWSSNKKLKELKGELHSKLREEYDNRIENLRDKIEEELNKSIKIFIENTREKVNKRNIALKNMVNEINKDGELSNKKKEAERKIHELINLQRIVDELIYECDSMKNQYMKY